MKFRSDRLLELRKQKGLSQAELAQHLDVSQSLVSYYESGSKQPGYETLGKMANLFSVSVEYLLGLTDNPHGTHLLDIASVNKITGTVAEAIITNPSLLESYQDFFEREDLQ
ncbi:MAG TPA: helix-turn-helix transcriptional regulator, partial [Firmicutes bacterium]|nr:helix-turn-helix transcriptional regulator [Bacillota bacterium]